MGDNQSSKDIWDKLDVSTKVLSGVVLAVIALVLKLGADNIASSMRSGELVQSLISDLTTKGTRRDVALIALNRSIGDENPRMVVEIAERVIREISQGADVPVEEQGALYVTALTILEERAPERAAELARSVLRAKQETDPDGAKRLASYLLSDVTVAAPDRRAELRSDPEGATAAPPPQTSLLLSGFTNLVYVQFLQETTRKTAEELRERLRNEGIDALGVEQVSADFHNTVRYFHEGDAPMAMEVAAISGGFLHESGWEVEFEPENFTGAVFKGVPQGQIEVWINLWPLREPGQGWCYQERDPDKPQDQRFGVHCHWSEQRCNEAKSESRTAAACGFVQDLGALAWNPTPGGWMGSWFQLDLEDPLPPPVPQFEGDPGT